MPDDTQKLAWIEETLGQAQGNGDWMRLTHVDEVWLVGYIHKLQAERDVLRKLLATFAYLRFSMGLVWHIVGERWTWDAVEKAYQQCLSATPWRNGEQEWRWTIER